MRKPQVVVIMNNRLKDTTMVVVRSQGLAMFVAKTGCGW